MRADAHFKEVSGAHVPTTSRGRPTTKCLFDVLGKSGQSVISEGTMRETTYVAMTVAKFPMLSYVNEPLSHFSTAGVKSTAQLIADLLQESMVVPSSISTAYTTMSPYKLDACALQSQDLSDSLPLSRLVPNDGDGIAILQAPNSIHLSQHHRLFAVDAPELFSTSFINNNGSISKQRNGHLSHLALHYYLNSFTEPQGTGRVCIERSVNREILTDRYDRPLSSFWFVWSACPNDKELAMIEAIIEVLHTEEANVKRRILNMANPRAANNHYPFLLSLNALLVLSGFCVVYTK